MIPILAEPGSLARGKLAEMEREIEVAAAAGVTHYKAQWISSVDRLVARRRAEAYRAWYELLAWPRDWHERLRKACEQAGIRYTCTTYLPEDVSAVAVVAQDYLKVASFEAKNRYLLDLVETHGAARGLQPLVSTGMLDRLEVGALLQRHATVWPLHCVSTYPAALASLQLALLRNPPFAAVFRRTWGYSDHSNHPEVGALAVAAGAQVVEVHFRRESTDLTHPDYETALDPPGLRTYVAHVRRAEIALGTGDKAHQPGELRAYQVAPEAL